LTERLRVLRVLAATVLASSCNPARAEWREVAPLPEARWFHSAALGGDGKIYAFGGYVIDPATGGQRHGKGGFSLVAYDPETDTWSHGPEVPPYSLRVRGVHFRREVGGEGRVPVPWERRVEIEVPHEILPMVDPQDPATDLKTVTFLVAAGTDPAPEGGPLGRAATPPRSIPGGHGDRPGR
jgi:hypothetical protein